MRLQRAVIMVGLLFMLASILLVFLLRADSTPESSATITPVRGATAGVILADNAILDGWDTVTGDFAETTVGSSRVIVFDRLNSIDRPGATLDQVVSSLIDRGARYFSIPAGIQGSEQLAEKYPYAVFIMNQSSRASVDALLIALNAAAPQSQTVSTPPPETDSPPESTQDSPIVLGLIALIGALILFGAVLGAWWMNTDPSVGKSKEPATVFQKMIVWASGPGRSKPKAKRSRSGGAHGRALMIEQAAQERATDFAVMGEPVIHKLSTYVNGDPHYDESFPVELLSGVFLGECGVSIAAPVNRYDAGRAAALEVWLFDKNDIRTAAAFLVSEHGIGNSVIQRALADKGEMVQAGVDTVIELETHTLRLRARVLALEYGISDTLPARSFFDYVVVELAVWQKQA